MTGLAFGAAFALAACGFTPVYGPGGAGGAFRDAIQIVEPDTDEEFAFVGRIEERLGRSRAGPYLLSFDLVTEEVELAIDGSNAITRFNIEGRLDWMLSQADTVIELGEETAFTAYSATGSTISTLESERDARRRLMVILADKVVAQLLTP